MFEAHFVQKSRITFCAQMF